MSWTSWTLASAVFLALYDLCKKASVRENAVLPVLLCSTLFGCTAFVLGLAAVGRFSVVAAADGRTIALGAVKSVIVATSWIFTFTALRTLPITIATPIRASSPALVFLVALFIYGEVPTWMQGAGMLLVFVGYWAFSWAGKAEGIDFLRSRAVWCAVAGAVLSAVSSLFDKFVFQKQPVSAEAVQFFFQVGLVFVYAVVWMFGRLGVWAFGCLDVWKCGRQCSKLPNGQTSKHPNFQTPHPFEWRWSIPFVGILLALADWLYFHGLAVPDAPVSVVALLRRFSVVITFVLGAVFFHETNLRRKALALAAVLVGVALLCVG